jgi:hypothetical protein
MFYDLYDDYEYYGYVGNIQVYTKTKTKTKMTRVYITKKEKEKQILLTEAEIGEIRKSVLKKLKKKSQITESMAVNVNQIFKAGASNETIDKFKEYQATVAHKWHVQPHEIQLKQHNYDWRAVVFYILRDEAEVEFEKRVEAAVQKRIITANNLKLKKLAELEKEKKRKKALLIKAIEELGPEIYDVFEELKLKSPKL